jgi:putative membrane protein insertion efficiency factor
MTVLRRIAIAPIRLYAFLVSPFTGPSCRFTPTCSAYAAAAIEKHGVARGIILSLRRILSCHPWSGRCGCDPVPERFTWRGLIRYTGTHK